MLDILHITQSEKISGNICVSGDKSISHRAIIFAAISDGVSVIKNLSPGDDVLRTIEAMRSLGVEIVLKESGVEVCGVGLHGLTAPKHPIDCGNAGTTMRLLCGLLSAQKFNSVLIGDASLSKRPMSRIAEPLRLMGAKINLSSNNTAPIEIIGNQKLIGIDYQLKIPSAQVKSGILIAGLYASGETKTRELIPTRDHTERMIGNPVGLLHGSFSRITPIKKQICRFHIPGDISSAAFFIALAAITKNSDITIRDAGVNPFRTGIIEILKLMGADITLFNPRLFQNEPVADIRIRYKKLHGIIIPKNLIASAIDEFPIILIAAATATGKTILRNAKELRVKETDRITAMVKNFNQLNIETTEYDDGIFIQGEQEFSGGRVDSFGDHRIAMAFAIAGNIANGPVIVDDCACIDTSFPHFILLAKQLGMNIA